MMLLIHVYIYSCVVYNLSRYNLYDVYYNENQTKKHTRIIHVIYFYKRIIYSSK